MAREAKLERLIIPLECRTVKDWFPTRESADAVIGGIRAHILATGEPHTWAGHTHTRPNADAVPVYIGEFSLPERFLRAKRFAPCPCCWDEFGKFGHGMIAWFPAERVIRLIGPDCFKGLNPEAHKKARRDYEIEQERKRNTDFLLSNLPRLGEVVAVIDRAVIVARALDTFHCELHGKLGTCRLNLWPYVRHEGQLIVNVKEKEFRRRRDGEMEEHEIDGTKAIATLRGYQMLDPDLGSTAGPLTRIRGRLSPYLFGDSWQSSLDAMDEEQKRVAADTLSRNVKKAREQIATIEELRRFADRVSINTLRRWGADVGCPFPHNYSHDGSRISFGRSDYRMVAVLIPAEMRNHIGQIDFWTELQKRTTP